MKREQPIVFVWKELVVADEDGMLDGIMAMVPVPRYRNVAARQFILNEEVTLERCESRSMASHNHYFAALQEGFDNLPERVAVRWPTAEHFRAWALCRKGWCEETEFRKIADEEEAMRLVTFVRTESPFAVIQKAHGPNGWVVIVRKPRSQSLREMGARDFQRSKEDVLGVLEELIGVQGGSLMKQAAR